MLKGSLGKQCSNSKKYTSALKSRYNMSISGWLWAGHDVGRCWSSGRHKRRFLVRWTQHRVAAAGPSGRRWERRGSSRWARSEVVQRTDAADVLQVTSSCWCTTDQTCNRTDKLPAATSRRRSTAVVDVGVVSSTYIIHYNSLQPQQFQLFMLCCNTVPQHI